ncbi:MAG: PAS domain S-box protein, partial [Methanoregula sp.]|nr:PAS domain S-box protein [Methanoregula sp.]
SAKGIPQLLLPHVKSAVKVVEEEGKYHVRIVDKELQHVFSTGQPVRSESPISLGDRILWFDHALVPIPDADGEITSVLGISRDITKRVVAEREQRQNERNNRFIAEHSVDIINRQTPECICTYASPSITTLLGYTEQEVVGTSVLAMVHPDDLPGVMKDIAVIRDSGQDTVTSSFRFRHKDGHYLWFESTTRIVRDEAGQIREYLSISRDITGRTPDRPRQTGPANNK